MTNDLFSCVSVKRKAFHVIIQKWRWEATVETIDGKQGSISVSVFFVVFEYFDSPIRTVSGGGPGTTY